MSGYEGLNLPQLLDLLHDIVRPEPVPFTPQTVGWAVIGIWLVLCIALIAWNRIVHWHRNRYRREALITLKNIATSTQKTSVPATLQIATLLKRTALVAYPRTQVANLYGSQWATFLKQSSKGDKQIVAAADMLASAAYRADVDSKELIKPARRWIKIHRV
ncbi:MAG: DUF4381 domain-containing protein [Pseudomonadales bacterium]